MAGVAPYRPRITGVWIGKRAVPDPGAFAGLLGRPGVAMPASVWNVHMMLIAITLPGRDAVDGWGSALYFPQLRLLHVPDGAWVRITPAEANMVAADLRPPRAAGGVVGVGATAIGAAMVLAAFAALVVVRRAAPAARAGRLGRVGEYVVEARFRREQRDFDALFRAHHAEIVRYLAARLGSREEAADIAAEVFVAAWQRVPGLRWRGRPVLAWLYRVAANMAADRRERPGASRSGRCGRCTHGWRRGRDGGRARCDPAPLRSFRPTAMAVHLRLVEGYPFADVARVMGRSVGACQMLVRPGRELQTALEREGVDAPR